MERTRADSIDFGQFFKQSGHCSVEKNMLLCNGAYGNLVFEISPCLSDQQKCCFIQEGGVALGREHHGAPSFLGKLVTETGFSGVIDKSVRIHSKQ